jgi:glycogen operon protein
MAIASGPWDPSRGHRFNPAKVLLDPCARRGARAAVSRVLFAFAPAEGEGPADPADSAPYAALGMVTEPSRWTEEPRRARHGRAP